MPASLIPLFATLVGQETADGEAIELLDEVRFGGPDLRLCLIGLLLATAAAVLVALLIRRKGKKQHGRDDR